MAITMIDPYNIAQTDIYTFDFDGKKAKRRYTKVKIIDTIGFVKGQKARRKQREESKTQAKREGHFQKPNSR